MNNMITFRETISAALGYSPDPGILSPGKMIRFSTSDKPHDRSGFAKLFDDGEGGIFGCWRRGISATWQSRTPDSPEERAVYTEHIRKAREEAAQIESALRAECRRISAALWQQGQDVDAKHPYLLNKGVKPHGIKQKGDALMIPVRGCDGILRGLQFIGLDGAKRFKTGTEVTGGYHAFGKPKENTILICEGLATGATLHEVTGLPVAVAFNAGNLRHVAEALRDKNPEWRLIVCADDDHATSGNPGLIKGTEAALVVGCLLAVPRFPAERGAKDSDFNDLNRICGPEAVRTCVEAAAIPIHPYVPAVENTAEGNSDSPKSSPQTASVKAQDKETLQQSVARLAALEPLEYERVRKSEAERLGIGRIGELDKVVKAARKNNEKSSDEMFPLEEPWHEAVDGLELVRSLVEMFERFCVLPKGSAITAALWTILTYTFNFWRTLPLLTIVSPEKRCGKTTFLTTLSKLCYRPLPVSNISPAALYRAIGAFRPALLIDEGDSFLKDDEALRGVVNSGHTKDAAFVIRCEGDDHKPVRFSTWCPKALAMIGTPPDTIQDRSIMLHLRRKLADERTEAHTEEFDEEFASTRAKILRWVDDNDTSLRLAKPVRLNTRNDRQADNWMPILAIAKVLGCESAVREAALLAAGNEQDELPARIELLCDIREVFEVASVERISSADLVKQLVAMEDRPWCEWKRGSPLTPNSMARLLKAFEIQPKQVRIGEENIKGYALEMFTDAFIRYTPPITTETTKQVNNYNRLGGLQNETRGVNVSVSNHSKYSDTLECFGVSVASEEAGTDGIDANEVPDFGDEVEVRACRA